jgi:sulfate/thiosulfate transport system ATP-binding protein
VYIRPHELELTRHSNGGPSMAARVNRINPAGSYAKIVLTASNGDDLQVDLPFDRFLELQLQCGENVFVTPRRMRVFAPEYEI